MLPSMFLRNQEKGVLAKGVSVESVSWPKNKKYLRILAPAVHLALRAPQPREAYILQKPPSKIPLFLVPDVMSLDNHFSGCILFHHPCGTHPCCLPPTSRKLRLAKLPKHLHSLSQVLCYGAQNGYTHFLPSTPKCLQYKKILR